MRARHIAITVTAIVAVLLALPLLLYVPPVQRWLVGQATAIASEATGLDISISAVSLRFPLTLSLEDVTVIRPVTADSSASPFADTIAVVKRLDTGIALLPLFSLRAEIGSLSVDDARLNTLDLISDTQVRGTIGRLAIDGTSADLSLGTVGVAALSLADADLCILLSDTAAVDTTVSEPLPWAVTLGEATFSNVSCELHTPGDSMAVTATIGKAMATAADIDLAEERYALASLRIEQTAISYDNPPLTSPPPHLPTSSSPQLLDPSHLAFSDLSLAIDSIVYCASCPVSPAIDADSLSPFLSFVLRQASLKEQCGLHITDLQGTVALDSLGIRIPSLSLHTSTSTLYAQLSLDYASLEAQQAEKGNAINSTSDIVLDASLSPHDLAFFYPLESLLNWPVSIKAKARGNMDSATIEALTLDLPTAFHAEANGTLAPSSLFSTSSSFTTNLQLSLQTQNTTPLLKALGIARSSWKLPPGISFDGVLRSSGQQYTTDFTVRDGQALMKGQVLYAQSSGAYTADINVNQLSLNHFVPDIGCTVHRAVLSLRGNGFDLSDRKTFVEASARIDSIGYEQWQADSISLKANIADGNTRTDIAIHKFSGLGISDKRLHIGLNGDITINTDFKSSHKFSGLLKDIVISDSVRTFYPENLGVLLAARPDTTYARIQNGNFIVKLDASGPYDQLISKLTVLADTLTQHLESRRITDRELFNKMLPNMRLYVTSGRDNAPANILKTAKDIVFKEFLADITTSPEKGLNGQIHLLKLGMGATVIDTAIVTLKDSDHGLTYQARIANEKNNPLVLTALMDGHLYEKGLRLGLRIFDKNGRQGLRLGTQVTMEPDGLRFMLLPKKPTLGFREFSLNDDNFLFLRKDLRLSAKLQMEDDNGTTIDIYSEEEDSTRLQDLTVSLAKLDLKQLTATLPFLPSIEGLFEGDFHIIMDQKKQVSVAADVNVTNMIYEGNAIGNIDTEFVYLQNTDNTHAVDGIIMREGRQIATLSGNYINKKVSQGHEYLDGNLALTATPLNMVNGFITEQIAGLEGYANGQFTMKGPLSKLIIDGSVRLDSATLFSVPYGITMGIDDSPITISHSKLILNNFKLYASPEQREKGVLATTFNFVNKAIGAVPQPADTTAYLTVTGTADFSGDGPAPLDFRVRANELLLINSRQQTGSLLYGKGFVSVMAMVRGTTEKMTVRGRVNVLGKTDITYLLLDSPLSTDNRMDELVKFTDFSDSTQVAVVHRPVPNGLDVNLTVGIDQGAHIRCGLNADQSNYVDIFGGGDLRLRMSQTEEMSLTGRYTLTNGTMKYSLPVIPLKTFTIQDGSYVEFTGRMDNPTLNITATERTRATVGQAGERSRSVSFDCGVVVTKTLNDMGVQFIISAPEDMTVQSELQSMTAEQRGKLAVTMLTTGMYLADGNTAGFSMNAALSSFLQSEINNIAGNALSTLDVSMGIDNTTDASGSMHTDYSFQFAKRFWNNRLKVQIGGKVSSGQEAAEGHKQSFFDNVSMEYRLSPTSNQYLKLFYKQNVYDWLDGYTGEYGVGYIYKRKLDHWWDMFRLWKVENSNNFNR